MKKLIYFDEETETFFQDYKKSHNVNIEAFIRSAVEKEIIKVKAELKIIENVSNK